MSGRFAAAVAGRTSTAAAIAAQGTQASAGLLIQVVAARNLGLDGLGKFGLLYGVMIVATALPSGFVGDSMAVLDRQRPSVRAALQNWLLLIAAVCASICFLGAYAIGIVDGGVAIVYGVATFLFLVEDSLRRLLMAAMRFWRITLVDITSIAVAVIVFVLSPNVDLLILFAALAGGQLVAIVVAVLLMPREEKWFASPRPASYRVVARYGIWRSLQLAVRPASLAATRAIVIGAAGLSAAGELEAARIYTAPAMLLVVGLGAYLFSSYARDKQRPLKEEIRSVDRQVVVLGGWIAMLSICIAVAVPQVSPLIAGQQVSMTMTIGWLVYILSVATTSCYANLAAVRGFERATLAVRSFDSGLSVIFVIAAMWVYQKTDSDLLVEAAPFAIAVGSFIGGFILRRYVLRPGSAPSDAPS